MIAPCLDGNDVGEAWSTYQWAAGLSEDHRLTILTYRKRERAAEPLQLPRARIIEWLDLPLVHRASRFNDMLKPGYVSFYPRARRWLRAALARGERFDLAHQISPLALRYPSPAAGLGIPLILGPLAGSIPIPAGFAEDYGPLPWYMRLRRLDHWRLRNDPLLRRSLEQAAVVIGVAPYVRELLSELSLQRFEVMGETGVPAILSPGRSTPGEPGRLRALFVGRLVRSKGCRDAIRALGRLSERPEVRLDIVGDGHDRTACEDEARRLGLGERVRFHGRVPRAEVDRFYERADVFLFPSFMEPSGNVVLEALSWGLPIVTAAAGGPGFVVDDSCGIRVEVRDPESYAAGLADALRCLSDSPELRRELAAGAHRRAEQVALWDGKIEWMRRLYQSVIAETPKRDGSGARQEAQKPTTPA